jgi:hypothetical protein
MQGNEHGFANVDRTRTFVAGDNEVRPRGSVYQRLANADLFIEAILKSRLETFDSAGVEYLMLPSGERGFDVS